MKSVYTLLAIIVCSTQVFAQGMISGYHAGKGHLNFSTYFNYEHYNTFFRGETKTDLPEMLEDMTIISSGLFSEYGITNNLDVSVNLPFIASSASADESPSAQNGLQDIAVNLKYSPIQTEHFNLMFSGSVSTPLSSYVTDAPVAIGHGSTNFDARVIAQYRWGGGLFFNAQIGHTYKTTMAPNTVSGGIRVGYALPRTYFHLWLENQSSTFGTDIGEGPFPSNRINFLRTGFIVVKPITPIVQLALGGSYVLNGRNIGQAIGANGGLIFKLTPSDHQKRKHRQKEISNKTWKKKALPARINK